MENEWQQTITTDEFFDAIATGCVVVKFGTRLSADCNRYDAAIAELSREFRGTVKFVTLNIVSPRNRCSGAFTAMEEKTGRVDPIPHIAVFIPSGKYPALRERCYA